MGFVGLGIMGTPMARNLVDAGYELVLYNRTRGKAERVAAGRGATLPSPCCRDQRRWRRSWAGRMDCWSRAGKNRSLWT